MGKDEAELEKWKRRPCSFRRNCSIGEQEFVLKHEWKVLSLLGKHISEIDVT